MNDKLHLGILIVLVFFLVSIGLYFSGIHRVPDCYMSPWDQCRYSRCSEAGLNFSRVVQHEGAKGFDCFCLNGTEEVVR
jgi:hypothetical protein